MMKKTVRFWFFLLVAVFLISSCKQIGLNTNGDTSSSAVNKEASAPFLVSIGPAENTTGVAINRSLSVTFNEAMDVAGITVNTKSTECSGSVQISSTEFSNCVQMSASPTAANGNRSFVFSPAQVLDTSTDYKIKVTTDVKDTGGQAILAEYLSAGGFRSGGQIDQTAPSVTIITPFTLYDRIPPNTRFVVTFSEPMNIPMLTTTKTGTTCEGSVQLSANGFATCVRMAGDPEPAADQKSFVITPATNLVANRSHSLKVTTAATDSAGNQLAEVFLMTRGLTTGTTLDSVVPTITNITPSNGFDNISLSTPVAVRFSERMNPASIRVNITNTNCSNTIRLSTDDFSSCIRMTSNIVMINAGRSFSFYPIADFSLNTHYEAKITIDAGDLAGNPLANEYFFASGYTTTTSAWNYATWDSNDWTD